MTDVLVFTRSLREGNYPLYIASLHKFIRWYFPMDHYNYARWLSVYTYDLLALPQNSPQLHKFFMDGYLTFQKNDRQFSLMGLDQIHEQNNAVMKGMGGATSSLNKVDESSLARWGLCIHELASIVNEYEFEVNDMNSPHKAQRHHEGSVAFQKRFTTDVNCLEKAVISNPFILEKLTVLNNHDKTEFNDRVFEDIKIIETEGEKQFLHFWEKRLVSAELPINVPIPLNSYNLPGNYNKKSAYDPVMTAVMMTKFVDAGKNRRYLVEDALNAEVFGIAQSLASGQFSPYHGTKSSIIASLIQKTDTRKIQPDASVCVIELSMLLRKKQPL